MKQGKTLLVKPIQIRLPPDAYLWVQKQVEEQDRSANYILNKIIGEALARAHGQKEAVTQ